jgi:hypothetical protein
MSDERREGSILIQASKRWLALFAVLTLVPWILFLLFSAWGPIKQCMHGSLLQEPEKTRWVASKSGPWGDLRIVRIVTEPPEESLKGYLLYPKPVWLFSGYTTNDFDRLLLSARLSAEQKMELERAAVWGLAGAGCSVSPQDEFVMNLSPESRAVLYNALSLFPENTFQNEPFRFRADMVDEWFENSGVPDPTIAMVRRLTYTRGKTIQFSDPHLILPKLPSDLERAHLLKTLSRQSTLMMQLHITSGADIASLVSYWGTRGELTKDIKPLLESVSRIPGGFNIDIAHLLPRFARKRIYTYPRADGDKGEMVYDCHWNSMNFWNDPPDDRFSDKAYVIHTLETDYESVLDGFRFGDVILFMKSDTQAIHSSVYIADNIVFTKNGPSQHSPWILMQMDTLVAHYETSTDVKIRAYRKKHDK